MKSHEDQQSSLAQRLKSSHWSFTWNKNFNQEDIRVVERSSLDDQEVRKRHVKEEFYSSQCFELCVLCTNSKKVWRRFTSLHEL